MTTLPDGRPIDGDALKEAMEDADLAHRYFLHLTTDEVRFISEYSGLSAQDAQLLEEIDESGDYVAVERIPVHEAYQWMVDFVDEVVAPADEDAAEKLGIALDGKGAFRRLRTTLQRLDQQWLQAWDQWRARRLNAAVDEWIEGIV
ncbi:MAG TPA: UPF0158 family protein [Ktedonobacteraceae bacterium]|jgi:hypothetical protein